MKKYYSKTLGVEAFALDVAQLDILKKAGQELVEEDDETVS